MASHEARLQGVCLFKVFIGSSSESRGLAEAVAAVVDEQPLFKAVPWWSFGVARSSTHFLESLFGIMPQMSFGIFVAKPDDLLIKRNAKQLAVRDNVLLEYGFFAGYLGRHNALFLQVGEADLPTDLAGITCIRLKTPGVSAPTKLKAWAREGVQRALGDLLCTAPGDYAVALTELRESGTLLTSKQLRPLLAQAMRMRISRTDPVGLTAGRLKRLLDACRRRGHREIGIAGHRTAVQEYIDLKAMEPEDLKKISASFARFASRRLRDPGRAACATRVALHYKPDLGFLAAVVAGMQVRPALVDLDPDPARGSLKGHWLPGETAIFLHDFTATGFTPLSCIGKLRDERVKTRRIVSFYARESDLLDLRASCKKSGLEFHVFCVQRASGELVLAGGR